MTKLRNLFFLFALTLAGCMSLGQATITDCAVLTALPLRLLMQAENLPSDPMQWIANTFSLDPSKIAQSYGKMGVSFTWNVEGVRYDLGISTNGIPEAIIHFETTKPTVGRMLECLGPPQSYRAHYFFHPPGLNSLIFEIYYPYHGITASYVYQTRNINIKNPPAINKNTPIDRVYVDVPGTSSEEYIERTAQFVIEEIKPWPGSLEAIEIKLGPFLESN